MNKKVRRSAMAGQFYPADASRLEFKIKEYLHKATSSPGQKDIKAIMVPHAGYDYSAPVAAYAYKAIEGTSYDNVILICNSHTAYFDGVAIDDNDEWETPLGHVPVNRDLAGRLAAAVEIIKFNGSVHADDHTLEVQLPFLQTVLPAGFKIVPMLFGNSGDDDYKKLAKALADNLGPNDLVVISTDMSHYPSYQDANMIDNTTLEIIVSGDMAALERHIAETENKRIAGEETLICGIEGVKTAMELSQLLGWNSIVKLHYANSGDSPAGSKDRVVGYGAIAIAQVNNELRSKKLEVRSENNLTKEQKQILLDIARTTVGSYVREKKIPEFDIRDERLNWKEGAFVTLKKDGELRGCIGQIVPTDDPLWDVVRDMAVAAATQDYRFAPVKPDELVFLDYEVSVLSQPEQIDDYRKIELGKHGVIVQKGRQGGVFLPQVATETSWSLDEFMSQLCSQKAGLDPNCYKYDRDLIIKVFTAQVF